MSASLREGGSFNFVFASLWEEGGKFVHASLWASLREGGSLNFVFASLWEGGR